ncbi:hypothetical protein IQ215_05890 [Cyanobacterium stanieri LEGE 03274]|uniref:Small CPxCG-related zinc finger protein n=1 Tax=Cyanobacterium stanieri LEGE 03274 TaxID=1828756 RepID=A0ABR9V2U7_9CHRO|nr:hypothetical protein [Cyanobacterium stanieri]MBE9222224.1 hypothetical protein [Cyanobacterium stanieri LEGE 03274]
MSQQGKSCHKCGQIVKIRYRIQWDNSEQWYQVCPDCWQKVSQNNPYYRYGGTWKAKRKRS